jgi:hypothetical protein
MDNFDDLEKWIGVPCTEDDFLDNFLWAWMNLSTRCFGHHHLPNEIAMCPLVDMINHHDKSD